MSTEQLYTLFACVLLGLFTLLACAFHFAARIGMEIRHLRIQLTPFYLYLRVWVMHSEKKEPYLVQLMLNVNDIEFFHRHPYNDLYTNVHTKSGDDLVVKVPFEYLYGMLATRQGGDAVVHEAEKIIRNHSTTKPNQL